MWVASFTPKDEFLLHFPAELIVTYLLSSPCSVPVLYRDPPLEVSQWYRTPPKLNHDEWMSDIQQPMTWIDDDACWILKCYEQTTKFREH